jgi:transposase
MSGGKEEPLSGKQKRRRWTAPEKLRVVLAGLDGSVEVSELCRREGINPTQYYSWRKQLVSSAAKVFADGRESKSSSREQRLEAENARLKSVVVEITAENIDLKKGLSD